MVKVNENELSILGNWCGCSETDKKELAEKLIEKFNLDALVVTEGSNGAWVIIDGKYYQVENLPKAVYELEYAKPRLMLGAGGKMMLRLAGRYSEPRQGGAVGPRTLAELWPCLVLRDAVPSWA